MSTNLPIHPTAYLVPSYQPKRVPVWNSGNRKPLLRHEQYCASKYPYMAQYTKCRSAHSKLASMSCEITKIFVIYGIFSSFPFPSEQETICLSLSLSLLNSCFFHLFGSVFPPFDPIRQKSVLNFYPSRHSFQGNKILYIILRNYSKN